MEDVVEGGILVGEQVVFARHTNPIVRRESSGSIKKFQHRKSITSLHASSSNDELKDSNDELKIMEKSAKTTTNDSASGVASKKSSSDQSNKTQNDLRETDILTNQDLKNSDIQRKAAERIAKKLLRKSAAISFTSKFNKSASTSSLSSKQDSNVTNKDNKEEDLVDDSISSPQEEEEVSSNISSDSCVEEDEDKSGSKSNQVKKSSNSSNTTISTDSGVPSSRSSLSSSASSQNLQLTKDEEHKESNSINIENSNDISIITTTSTATSEIDSQTTHQSNVRLSKNAEHIEALLRRINEENKRTREVLDNIQKSDVVETKQPKQPRTSLSNQFKSTSSVIINALSNSMSSVKERTTSTFLDAYNNNDRLPSTTKEEDNSEYTKKQKDVDNAPQQEGPMVCWETSGEGKKIPIVIFSDQALSRPQAYSVGSKYHLTFKTVNADAKLISQICHAHGFHEVHASNTDYNLNWTGIHPKPHAFKSMLPHQRVNHFPRSYELTRKDRLYQNIERLQHSKGSKHFNFVPKTFMIPAEYSEFAATHHRMRGAWIVKPVASSRGRGIFIVSHPSQVPLDEPMVVAKYIDNPLLVNGHKWDLRLYVAVTSYDPLIIYLYEEGLVRFATVRYDSSGKNLWNPCMHLCNYSINKYHSDYIKCDDPDQEDQGHKWSLSALLRHLKANNIDTVQLMQAIEDVIIKSIISVEFPVNSACKMFVPHRRNCFELYGFDILIDSDLKPWLLEVNLSPSLNCEAPIDMKIKSALICDLLNLVGLPATDPVLRRAQFNQKVINMTQQDEATRARLSKRAVSMETRRFAAIRLAATSTSLSQELSKMVKNAREEHSRRGGYVRIFPTTETWSLYGSILEFSSPNNQILHEHLFPDAMKKHHPHNQVGFRNRRLAARVFMSSEARLSGFWNSNRKRSQSANGKFDREKNAVKNEGDGEDQARDLAENEMTGKTQKSHSLVPSSDDQKENSAVSRSRSGSHPGIASSASPSTTRRLTSNSNTSNSNIGVGERKPTGYSKLTASSLGLNGGITTSTSTSSNNAPGRNSRLSEEIEDEIYPKPTASELRVAQYEKPLTKGHCPKRKSKVQNSEGTEKKVDEKTDSEKLAKRRSEKRERSHVLKEKIIKLIESGLQLSEYQARKAFSVYLHCILLRLSDYDDGAPNITGGENNNGAEGSEECGGLLGARGGPNGGKNGHAQIELVLKFLQKAALSLREPYFLKAPSAKLSGKDRAAIVAKELNEFLGHYRRETECFTVFKEEAGMVPRHTFEEFIAFANDSDLEDVLTLQTKLYRCAHIFLGKCLPPVTGRKNSLLRTAYGISPDRNLRDKQCSMRMNARANPPVAPQFTLPPQTPHKCLDISTTKEAAEEKEREKYREEEEKIVRIASVT